MIRPLTIATFLLACGSGLYLYQSKHEAQLLDRTIERTVHETNALREQSRLLAVEWTMLNDPERLRRFSDTYLSLKTIEPRQFASLGDLNDRLPPPRADVPPRSSEEQEALPIGSVSGAQPGAEPNQGSGVEEVLPLPPIPAMRPIPVIASAGRPLAEPKVAEIKLPLPRPPGVETQARSVVAAEARMNDQRAAEPRAAQRLTETHAEVRPPSAPPPRPIALAAPRPVPVIAQLYAQPAPVPVPTPAPIHPAANATVGPYTGSLLGMARGNMPAAPRPTPVSASYNAN